MPFWRNLEVLGAEFRAVQPNPTRIGHVHNQPQASRTDPVDRLQQPIHTCQIRLQLGLYQLMGQAKHGSLGFQSMFKGSVPGSPASELRLDLRMMVQLVKTGQ